MNSFLCNQQIVLLMSCGLYPSYEVRIEQTRRAEAYSLSISLRKFIFRQDRVIEQNKIFAYSIFEIPRALDVDTFQNDIIH